MDIFALTKLGDYKLRLLMIRESARDYVIRNNNVDTIILQTTRYLKCHYLHMSL